MGSGKTTVAKALGKKLKRKVIEIDEISLAASKRKSINEIFEKDGEIGFRELEIASAKKVSKKKNVILSTGGGIILNKINLDYLKRSGIVIYLETSFDIAEKRLFGTNDRPLFKNSIAARKLYEFRKDLYDFYSDYMVNTDRKTPDEVVDDIIRKIGDQGK